MLYNKPFKFKFYCIYTLLKCVQAQQMPRLMEYNGKKIRCYKIKRRKINY